ncbi:RES domain-containing protein [Deferribacter autotrophicus]|uniref:RES domain-containing protein n=1 Tax=Deferribacter autotrophicus TaxID=500465 RepID=A0A5A8F668_9BACT|nr:RES family NAD+ phosphorylase [Deferribacter autotrophicus]KAA0259045.1 RES domain-containing protein [Deferribacter autotrophicus]
MLKEEVFMTDIPVIPINWGKSFRIIPTLYPERTLFDFVDSREELEYIYFIESLTNDRIKNELGNLELVPEDEWIFGEGTTPIMAAFTHPSPARFNTEYFGVYYASKELVTAIKETVYHREKFYTYNKAPANAYHMRVYCAKIKGNLFYDIRNEKIYQIYYHENDYTESQKLGVKAKKENKDGIVYKSVRHPKGTNIAVLRPKVIVSPCNFVKLLLYYWNGEKIEAVVDLGDGKIYLMNKRVLHNKKRFKRLTL